MGSTLGGPVPEAIQRAQAEPLGETFNLPDDLKMAEATREQLAAALQRTRRALDSFRLIAESSMAGLYLLQRGVFQYVNPAFVQLFGYRSAEEIVGRQPVELVHPEDRATVAEYIRQRVEGEAEAVRYSFRGLRADGSEIRCEVLGRAIRFDGDPAIAGTVIDVTERNAVEQERQRAQEALRQSEQRYRAVAESANTGIAIADSDNRLTYVNPALAELLKYRVEDLEGALLSELTDPDQYQILVEQTKRRTRGERSQYELTLNRRDGEKRHVLVSASPIFDAQGKYQAGIGVLTDITELKSTQDALSVAIVRMEDALERTRELAQTEEALRDTISSLSGSLNLDEVLERILENVGRVVPHDTADIMLLQGEGDRRELRAVRGRGYRERGTEEWVLGASLPWREMQNFRRMERTGRPVAISDTRAYPGWVELPETSWIRSYAGAPLRHMGQTIGFLNLSSELPGAYRQVHADSLQVFADQAAVAIENARLYAQAQDEIAERKRVERALRGSEKRYRKVFEGVQDAILVLNLGGEILEANHGAYALFGLDDQDRSFAGQIPQVTAILSQAGGDPSALPTAPIELELAGAQGRQFPVELRFQPHRLDDQAVVLVVGRDITDRKLGEEAERELVRMKVQFILSASHSLRTPLHTLMGFLELLTAGKVTDPERQADFLRRAAEDAGRIYALISELMDTARIEVGEQGLQLETVDAGDLIDRVVAGRQLESAEAGVRVLHRRAAGALTVQADPVRLGAALDAILHNAVRYSPSGTQVELQVERAGQEVCIDVRDHGPGIADADLQALLGKPDSSRPSAARPSSGPGLGLYLANSILRAHGGRLEIDSRLGSGTVVRMCLPGD